MVRRLPLLLLLFVPAVLIGLQQPPPMARGVRIVDITAAVPEAGGFQPDSVTVYAGQRVQLRFRSADTTHGVAIGPGLGIDLGDLPPGEVKVVDVTFPEGGTYTFYCNKWCSPNHWRMRGVIAVENPRTANPIVAHDPVIDNLAAEGVDIDAYLAHGAGSAHTSSAHRQVPAARRWLPRSSGQPRSTPKLCRLPRREGGRQGLRCGLSAGRAAVFCRRPRYGDPAQRRAVCQDPAGRDGDRDAELRDVVYARGDVGAGRLSLAAGAWGVARSCEALPTRFGVEELMRAAPGTVWSCPSFAAGKPG